MTYKTDWTAEDYYNLEDHNRIVSNLNQAAVPEGLTPIKGASMGEHLTKEIRDAMRDRFNAAMRYGGSDVTLTAAGPNWFDWRQLNTMEYWLEYSSHKYLEDRNKAVVVDASGRAITMPDKGYRSAFTGQEIDALASLGE